MLFHIKSHLSYFVDVIGVVQDMGYCQMQEGIGKKLQVNFTLKDLNGITLNCTLWEDYAGRFIQYSNERKEGGPVILMLKYGKVKEEGLLCVFSSFITLYLFVCFILKITVIYNM